MSTCQVFNYHFIYHFQEIGYSVQLGTYFSQHTCGEGNHTFSSVYTKLFCGKGVQLGPMNCCHTPYLLTIVFTYVVRRQGICLTAKLTLSSAKVNGTMIHDIRLLTIGSYNTTWVDYISSFRCQLTASSVQYLILHFTLNCFHSNRAS